MAQLAYCCQNIAPRYGFPKNDVTGRTSWAPGCSYGSIAGPWLLGCRLPITRGDLARQDGTIVGRMAS